MNFLPPTRRFTLAGLATLPFCAGEACSRPARDAVASILDYIPSSQHGAIAARTSAFDAAPALQRAIDETASAGATLHIPSGRYMLLPVIRLNHADPHFACHSAVRMRSGMTLKGEAGAELRIVDHYSTDATPRAMAMFGSDIPLRSLTMEGLILDMNGRNNPISPGRRDRSYSRAPQAHIFVSGGPAGDMAKIDDVAIARCRFHDSNGVSCIVTAQTAGTDRLGRNWRINDCAFTDNGGDTDDHSSIYGYADDMVVERCIFANPRPFDGAGGNTGYEVHGSNQVLRGNSFKNYMRGIWVANNMTATVKGTRIADNQFDVMFAGVDFFRNSSVGEGISQTYITGNTFRFDDTGFDTIPQLNLKAAVQIASEYGQSDVFVSQNTMVKTGDKVASAFVVITGGAQGSERQDRIFVRNNRGSGMTFGSFVRTTPTAGLGNITITGNAWTDLTPAGAFMVATGDGVDQTGTPQPIRSLTLGGGRIVETRGRKPVPAVVINGSVQQLLLTPIDVPKGLVKPLILGGTGRIVTTKGTIAAK